MNRDEMYQAILDKAIENGVELTDNAYKIANARCICNAGLDVCICHRDDKERFCISKKCMEDIQNNGVCGCNCYRKVGK